MSTESAPQRPRTPAEAALALMNVAGTRSRMGLTQPRFADRFGLSVASLRNWEQHTRIPEDPVALYLHMIDRMPEQVAQMVAEMKVEDSVRD